MRTTGGEDCDGDGIPSIAVGGADCDDTDANRYPGNAEIADFDGHDEDCDPTTIGNMDRDGDGFIDHRVFNVGDARGDDCDGEIDNRYGEWWSPAGTPPR